VLTASGKLGRGAVTAELVQPRELVSGIISQVAAQPELGQLLSGFIYASEGEAVSRKVLLLDHFMSILRIIPIQWCITQMRTNTLLDHLFLLDADATEILILYYVLYLYVLFSFEFD
jgi:hypothetical protein